MDLSKRQLIALRNPCFEAEQCSHQRYYAGNVDAITSGLTLNIGME